MLVLLALHPEWHLRNYDFYILKQTTVRQRDARFL